MVLPVLHAPAGVSALPLPSPGARRAAPLPVSSLQRPPASAASSADADAPVSFALGDDSPAGTEPEDINQRQQQEQHE
jgi:hypothetical protein